MPKHWITDIQSLKPDLVVMEVLVVVVLEQLLVQKEQMAQQAVKVEIQYAKTLMILILIILVKLDLLV